MAALIAAARDPAFPAEIVLVVSNRPSAPGLLLAQDAGVSAVALDHRPFAGDRTAHEAAHRRGAAGGGDASWSASPVICGC